MKTVLLLSGGLDSYIAYHYLKSKGEDVMTLYIDLGSVYSEREKKVVKELIPETLIVEHKIPIETKSNGFVPARNLLFACIGAQYGDKIVMGGLKDDVIEDKNKNIFEDFSTMLTKISRKEVIVDSPFRDMTKDDIFKRYLEQGLDKEMLKKTISCYSEDDTHYCGKCPACFRKRVVFNSNGVYMPYYNSELVSVYEEKCRAGKYDEKRAQRTLEVIERRKHRETKTYAIDIDGILTIETEGHNYDSRTPNNENIAKVKELKEKYGELANIVIFTSRDEVDRKVTEIWLKANNVPYDSIIFNKPKFDVLVDDKAKSSF